MKKNKFKKILTRDDINIIDLVKRENKIKPFKRNDFDKFLFKFCGSFIYRGNKSYSMKAYEFFLMNFKKNFKKNPTLIFINLIKILMPFLILGKKKFRGKSLNVPVFVKGNKKNVLLINWLIRQFKNRSNKKGVDKFDVLKGLIDTYNKKSSAINYKKDHYIEAYKARRNLRTRGFYYKMLRDWKKEKQNEEIEKREKIFFDKHTTMNETEIIWYNMNRFNIKPSNQIYKEFIVKKKKHGN